jgi:hypothetical protein
MDGNAQNEVAQGNSMLSDMREHNREVLRHNLTTKASFDSQIMNARKSAREAASDKKAETMGAGLGEGGAQALKLAKQGVQAYSKIASGPGYQGMGRAEVGGRTAVQMFKDAPVGKAVSKAAGAVSDVAEAARPLAEAAAPVARDAIIGARTALSAGGRVGTSAGETTSVGTIAGPRASALTDTPDARAPPSVSTIAGPKTQPLGGAAKPDVAAKPDAPKVPLKTAGPADAEGMLGKGIDFAEKGGALLNIASGGMDAIEDAVAGHVMGHNKDSKAGNELGIAGGVASLAGFAIPGMGLIGAGLGIAAGVESMIGAQKHSKKEITQTLPGQEKAEEEQTVKYAGATAESKGQDTQTQAVPQAKTGGAGATAF